MLRREAVLNLRTRGSRSRMLGFVAVLCGLAVVAQSLLGGMRHAAELRQRVEDGHGVLTFQAADPQRAADVSLVSCEALADDPRVERAGALTAGRLTTVPQLGRDQRVIAASVGLLPELGRHRVLLGAALPPVSGSLLLEGAAADYGRLGRQPRGVDVNSSVVVPVAPDLVRVDQCVVVLHAPVGVAATAPDLAGRLDARGGPVSAAGPGLRADDLAARYLARGDRGFGIAAGCVAGLLACVVNRFRSGELAVYRLSGTSRADLARLVVVEQVSAAGWCVAAVATSVPWVAQHLVSPTATVLAGTTGAVAWVLVAVAGSLPEVLRNPLSRVPGG